MRGARRRQTRLGLCGISRHAPVRPLAHFGGELEHHPDSHLSGAGETVGSAGPPPLVTGTLVAPAAGQPLVIAPPPATVRSYVVEHPVDPVYLNGEVVSGAGLPSDVALAPIPGYQYQYAYVNNQPVLVEPQTRRVEYIYR